MRGETAIESELKLCFYIFRIFGQEFFSIRNLRREIDQKKIRKWPTLGPTLHFIVLVTLVVVQNFYLFFMVDSAFRNTSSVKSFISNFVENSSSVMFFVACLTSLVMNFWMTGLHKEIYIDFQSMYEKFNVKLNHKVQHKKLLNTFFKRFFFSLCMDFGNIPILFVVNEFFLDIGYFQYLTWGAVTIFLLLSCSRHLIFHVYMIDLYLEAIQEVLLSMSIEKSVIVRPVINPSFVHTKNSTHIDQSPYEKLSSLKKIYGMLWRVSEKTNKAHGTTLVTSVVLVVVSLAVMGYKALIVIISGRPFYNAIGNLRNFSKYEVYWIAFPGSCTFMFSVIWNIFDIVISAEKCASTVVLNVMCDLKINWILLVPQVSEIAALLHNFEFDQFSNGAFRQLIQEFSIQILHQPIVFSASKFCNMNFPFIASVSVLLQYANSSKTIFNIGKFLFSGCDRNCVVPSYLGSIP